MLNQNESLLRISSADKSQLIEKQGDLSLHQVEISSPHLMLAELKQFLSTQNWLHESFKNPNPWTYLRRNAFVTKQGSHQGIQNISLNQATALLDDKEQADSLVQILKMVNPKIQMNIQLSGYKIESQTLEALIRAQQESAFRHLKLTHCEIHGKALLKAIQTNQIQVRRLTLEGSTLSGTDKTQWLKALDHNYYVKKIQLVGYSLSRAEQAQIREIEKRNQWLSQVQKHHPYDTLKLRQEQIPTYKFKAITHLIEKGQYRHIELPNGRPTNSILKQWIKGLRNNDKLTRLVYHERGLDKNLTHELQRQVNINRAIKKVFGSGSILWARSSTMFGFMGFNFFQSFAMAIAPAYAMMAGLIGGAVIASLRVLSNAWYNRSLHHTKAKDYWQNETSQQAYELGRQSVHSWAPWFSYKSWTTPGYLGNLQEKSHMEPAVVKDRAKPSP